MSDRFIFEGDDRFAQCHASTLVRLDDNRTLASWFGGTREKNPDTAIWAAACSNGKWTKPKMMAKVADVAHWNPVLFKDAKSRIHLFFKVGAEIEDWETWVTTLERIKQPWSVPKKICLFGSKGGRGPVRSKPIILSNGDWLAPASIEKVVGMTTKVNPVSGFAYRSPLQVWDSFVDRSTNDGRTWRKGSLIPYDREKFGEYGGIIQPTIWESDPGHVHMLLRSTEGYLFRSDSEDYGKTWTVATKTDIPNPNSGVDVAKREDGLLMLIYNPVSGNWVKRSPLSVAFSEGSGDKWSEPVPIQSGMGSYSYPSAIATDGGFAMTYTWNRKSICFFELTAEKTGVEEDGTLQVKVHKKEHPKTIRN